jgi:hypothetical protein
MRLVTRNDIENWADTFDSKGKLPILISRLVRVTTPPSTSSDFPSDSSAFVGGWDGIVKCKETRGYVPEGISLWEFGTEAAVKGKADEDYEKRTNNPLGYVPEDCTFVFLTPRFWRNKEKWRTGKVKDGRWKAIHVYDSRNLEEWLDSAFAVSRWFSSYLNKYPLDGIQTPDEFWEEWSIGPKCTLCPEVVIAGREFEHKLLLDFLKASPGIRAVKASTQE